jgi:hypothetical protein
MVTSEKSKKTMKTVADTAENLAEGKGWCGGDSLIINNGSDNDNATMSQLNQIRIGVKTNGEAPESLSSATIVDTKIEASDLNALASIVKGKLMLLNPAEIVGLASEIVVSINDNLIDLSKIYKATITGSSADANDLMVINNFIVDNKKLKL